MYALSRLALTGLLLSVTACGDGSDDLSPTPTSSASQAVRWVDGDIGPWADSVDLDLGDEYDEDFESLYKNISGAPNMIRGGTGRCIDNSAGGTGNGNKIQSWDCDPSTSNQTWTFKGGQVVGIGGKCMDVKDGAGANGTQIQIWGCVSGNTSQAFNYSEGMLKWTKNTGKCVDVSGSNTANGTKIQLYDCNESNAQQWSFLDGSYRSALGNKCLDVAGGSTANGTKVQLYDCNGSSAQAWSLKDMAIVNPNEKCLDVAGGATANGTKVQLYSCNGSSAQKWTWTKNDIKALGKCLDFSNSSTANGTQAQIWSCDGGTPAQNWYSNGGMYPSAPLPNKPGGINGNCRVGGACARGGDTYKAHSGTDFMVGANTEVKSICSGTVKHVAAANVENAVIIVEHTNCGGYPKIYAYYGHVRNTVAVGASVSRGTKLGTIWDWGGNSHLHFGLSTTYRTSSWGYGKLDVSTGSSCSNDNTRRDKLLSLQNNTGSGGWIDSYSFGRTQNWWGGPVAIGACN